jgi:5-methylcytosine-specific restriction enzyme A
MFETRKERQEFYLSSDWRNLRAYKLQLQPLCEECLSKGIFTPASEVHHKVDIKQDPSKILDYSNLSSLCKPCHSSHTLTQTRKANRFKRGHLKLRYGLK